MDSGHREAILRDLESSDEEVRRQAVASAHALPADQAVPRLAERLGDPSWRVRKAAVEALGTCPEPERAASLLIEGLGDGENPGRRNAALEALVRCGRPVVPALIEVLVHPDVDVRKQVVDALGGIQDPGSAEAVARVLDDEDPNVRAAAAEALGAIGWPQSAAALKARPVAFEYLKSPVSVDRAVNILVAASADGSTPRTWLRAEPESPTPSRLLPGSGNSSPSVGV